MTTRSARAGPAIALALALWGLTGKREPEVFARVSVYPLSVSVLVRIVRMNGLSKVSIIRSVS
jgi:hypothetical protein